MANMTSISSVLICTTRMWVAMPRNSTTGGSTSAAVVVCDPPTAVDCSASVMIAADSTLRKTVARLIASFQISDRNPSRLQCSVARIVATSGPNGCSLAGLGAALGRRASGGVARRGRPVVPVSRVASIAVLLEPAAAQAGPRCHRGRLRLSRAGLLVLVAGGKVNGRRPKIT
jgi:hypothetical protein